MATSINLSTKLTRSGFLRHTLGHAAPVIRPPWAVAEGDFQELCTGCDDCIDRCPTFILKKARGGYPVVNFDKNECIFCGDCVKACKPQALQNADGIPPWTLIALIDTSCLSSSGITCRICGDRCDTQAISFKLAVGGKATPIIDPSLCTGCGACIAPCPVDAVDIQSQELRA